ncbi:TlpA disulfide reductase family protein [Streptomyces sp. TRM 70351]|uniref:TlpA family protein disulfide reductase n=1 Tax=Streptomyces sp. TRM 70351 TaxID=3116552 RepID=UPI002E7BE9A0|nr:TlpA disulfide reductase family protein [Streptomyces sp. TRM 70351]MEE1931041.1 TlpA disulfide reductase family protein [Streptomyces sp. TRM 70351]
MSIRRALRRRPGRRPNRRAAALAAVAVAGSLALTACSSPDRPGSGENSNYVAGTGEITRVPAQDRKAAPDLEGEGIRGEQLKLSEHRGKVVVLNVWGSWCPPCRAEAPNFAEVSDGMRGEDVQFLGINTRDLDVVQAQKFDERFGIDYPSFYDPSGKLVLKFPKGDLNPQAIPSTLVLDREGRIAVRALKALSAEDLRGIIEPVLAEK